MKPRFKATYIYIYIYYLNILFQAIGRLSSNDPTLIKTSCEIMNRVSTKGEYLHEIIEKIEKEKKLDETLLNEGISEKKDMQWNFEKSTNCINMDFTTLVFLSNALTVFISPTNKLI